MGKGGVMVKNYSTHVVIKYLIIAGTVITNDNDNGLQ